MNSTAIAPSGARRDAKSWIVALALAGWVIFNLPALLTYPTRDDDEPLFSSVAYNFATHGSFGLPIFGDIYGSSTSDVFRGRLFSALLAGFFKIIGVGFAQARLFSLLGGLLCGLLVWRVGVDLYDGQTGFAAMLLFLFSWRNFYASHRARPDIWIAVGTVLLTWLYLRARRGYTPAAAAALGFASIYFLDIHLPVVFVSAAIIVLVALDFIRRKAQPQTVIAFAGGLFLGIAALLATRLLLQREVRTYVRFSGVRGAKFRHRTQASRSKPEQACRLRAVILLPDPTLAVREWQGGSPGTPPNSLNFADYSLGERIRGMLMRLDLGFLSATRLGWLESGMILGGLAALAARREEADRTLLAVTAISGLAFLVSPYQQLYYLIMFVPLLSLVVARGSAIAAEFVTTHWPRAAAPPASLVAGAFVAPLVIAYFAGDALLTWRNRQISYGGYADALRAIVPSGQSLAGEGGWWYEFHESPFTADFYLLYAPEAFTLPPETWLRQALAERQVEVVLLDERLGPWRNETISPQEIRLRPAFEALVRENCRQIGEVSALFYGTDQGTPAVKNTSVWQCGTWSQ